MICLSEVDVEMPCCRFYVVHALPPKILPPMKTNEKYLHRLRYLISGITVDNVPNILDVHFFGCYVSMTIAD